MIFTSFNKSHLHLFHVYNWPAQWNKLFFQHNSYTVRLPTARISMRSLLSSSSWSAYFSCIFFCFAYYKKHIVSTNTQMDTNKQHMLYFLPSLDCWLLRGLRRLVYLLLQKKIVESITYWTFSSVKLYIDNSPLNFWQQVVLADHFHYCQLLAAWLAFEVP